MSLPLLAPFLASPMLQDIRVGKIANRPNFTSFCVLFRHVAPSPLHSFQVGDETSITPLNLGFVISPALRNLRVHLFNVSAYQSLKKSPVTSTALPLSIRRHGRRLPTNSIASITTGARLGWRSKLCRRIHLNMRMRSRETFRQAPSSMASGGRSWRGTNPPSQHGRSKMGP